MTRTLISTAAILLLSHSAMAQSSNSWNGTYVGLTFGYFDGKIDEVEYDNGIDPIDYWYDGSGVTGGAVLGQNFRRNQTVYGFEGEVLFGGTYEYEENEPDYVYNFDTKAVLGVRGRVGYLLNDATLVYGALGASYGLFKLDWDDADDGQDTQSISVLGASIAGGVEYAISDKVNIRGELRHTRYQTAEFESEIFDGYTYEDDIKNTSAMLTITMRPSFLFGR